MDHRGHRKSEKSLEAAKEKPVDNQAELPGIFEAVHSVKGQGGSLVYNLLTKIGGSFCDYLRAERISARDKKLKVIAAHFSAMNFGPEKDIKGDAGNQLTTILCQLVAKTRAPE